jgi:Ca2+-binding EF-hand superfamily protein
MADDDQAVTALFQKLICNKYSDVEEAFTAFDRREKGVISRTDFKRGLKRIKLEITDEER